jgi:hypothetical protein
MGQEDSGVLPALRSLAIFTALAFGFYFLLVWNPVGSLGDVRSYVEHRVRVPVEWIVMLFPVAWLLQRNIGYGVAAAFLVPIFVVILTLTKPDYGAEFWSIFRHCVARSAGVLSSIVVGQQSSKDVSAVSPYRVCGDELGSAYHSRATENI